MYSLIQTMYNHYGRLLHDTQNCYTRGVPGTIYATPSYGGVFLDIERWIFTPESSPLTNIVRINLGDQDPATKAVLRGASSHHYVSTQKTDLSSQCDGRAVKVVCHSCSKDIYG